MNIKPLLISLTLIFSGAAQAGIVEGFYVVDVRVDRSGHGFISFDQDLNLPANCINNHPRHLSFNVNNPAGRSILSLALSAQAQKARVWAWGTNSCEEYSNTVESWSYGWINKE
ncbi:hypothetical protein [Motilimonas cestriensis]|uniref:hypothetical protein n=1 Tax=Motilimonas cestriensis TaxID=2742685 RepID=UPI003DA62ECA